MTDWNVGSGARNDLLVEAAQMAKGHIGFGSYRALHHDGDEVDLLESGDVNNEVEDEASLSTFNSFNDEAEHYSADDRIVAEGWNYKIYPMNDDKHPPPKKEKNMVSARKKTACYETVSSAHHRVQAWLVDETNKYTMFFRHLRIT